MEKNREKKPLIHTISSLFIRPNNDDDEVIIFFFSNIRVSVVVTNDKTDDWWREPNYIFEKLMNDRFCF